MKISNENKKILTDEFTFVLKKMESSETPDQMLYYFSGLYGMMLRILNIKFSSDLLFAHFVTENTHKSIVERLEAIKSGQNVVTFHEDFGPKLIDCTKELKAGFYNSNQRVKALNKLVVLSYTSTGNGYYLTEKGMIDIFSEKKQIVKK